MRIISLDGVEGTYPELIKHSKILKFTQQDSIDNHIDTISINFDNKVIQLIIAMLNSRDNNVRCDTVFATWNKDINLFRDTLMCIDYLQITGLLDDYIWRYIRFQKSDNSQWELPGMISIKLQGKIISINIPNENIVFNFDGKVGSVVKDLLEMRKTVLLKKVLIDKFIEMCHDDMDLLADIITCVDCLQVNDITDIIIWGYFHIKNNKNEEEDLQFPLTWKSRLDRITYLWRYRFVRYPRNFNDIIFERGSNKLGVNVHQKIIRSRNPKKYYISSYANDFFSQMVKNRLPIEIYDIIMDIALARGVNMDNINIDDIDDIRDFNYQSEKSYKALLDLHGEKIIEWDGIEKLEIEHEDTVIILDENILCDYPDNVFRNVKGKEKISFISLNMNENLGDISNATSAFFDGLDNLDYHQYFKIAKKHPYAPRNERGCQGPRGFRGPRGFQAAIHYPVDTVTID